MSEVLKLEIRVICLVHIIAIIFAIIFFMIFYMKAKREYALNAFFVMQVSIIGWMIFKIFKTISPTEVSRWWFIVAYYFCACIFEVAFLEFAYSYYKEKPLKKRIRIIIYIISATQFLFVITNPMHYLFYSKYDFWGDSFGILFYIHTVIEYIFIIIGFRYGYLTFKERFKNKKSSYKILIASTIILPLILNFLFITKVLHKFIFSIGIPVIFDITPIVFVFSTLVFVYATFNHNFINLSPILRHEVVHKLDTSICLIDSSFNVIYLNQKMKESLGNVSLEKLTNRIKKLDIYELINKKSEIKINNKIFNIYIRKLNTFKETQYLLIFYDITDYKNLENKILVEQEILNNRNKELKLIINKLKKVSKIGARNYVARELHDIMGHSLVVTIKLLEVAKLYYKKDKSLSNTSLKDAPLSIDIGIKSMNSINEKRSDFSGETLKKDIDKILNRMKNIKINTHFNFRGLYYHLEEKTYDVISRTCLELITNSLKHSGAKDIFISLDIKKDIINLKVMDNGKGCHVISLGNGLKAIKERIELINGQVEFITSSDEGFMSKIEIKR